MFPLKNTKQEPVSIRKYNFFMSKMDSTILMHHSAENTFSFTFYPTQNKMLVNSTQRCAI